MQLIDLKIESLEIPFKVAFEHSSASRSTTEAVLVTATTKNGKQGLGEGCPRSYVTGETVKSAQKFFSEHRTDFLNISSLSELQDWVNINVALIDKNPAAFCSIELALLHALSQENNTSLEGLLSLPELSGRFRYTGVLGSSKADVFSGQLKQYLKLGFTDLKIKLFGKPEVDQKNIETLKGIEANSIRVRFDANNLWKKPQDAIDYIQSLAYPVFAIEEPLKVGQYLDNVAISTKLDSKIILDESFTKKSDFSPIETTPNAWVINIRISKMGGVLRSLTIAKQAKKIGIPIIIGAQVGETSILTRAALTVANCFGDQLIAQEGAFGTHLLQKDIIEPPVMFGAGGWLDSARVRN